MGLGAGEPGARSRKPTANSRKPGADSLQADSSHSPTVSIPHYLTNSDICQKLAVSYCARFAASPFHHFVVPPPPVQGWGRAQRAGRGPPKANSRKPGARSRQPEADSRKPAADSQQPIADSRSHGSSILPFITQSNDWNP
jgi:hypothetical protein